VALAVDTNSNTDEIDDGSAAGMSESHQNENDDNDANDKNNEECEICGDGGGESNVKSIASSVPHYK
jgi:hypothetical protein